MDSDSQPLDRDREVAVALEMSGLRDEIEALGGRRRSTLVAGLAMTVLFFVAGTFMDKTSTLWFLGAMWLFLSARLVLVNKTSEREMRINQAALESLANPQQGGAFPHVTRTLIVLATMTVLGSSAAHGQYRDPGTNEVLGFSDAAHVGSNQYVVVFDTKGHEAERRLGLLELKPDAEPVFTALPTVDWKDNRSKASDLEGICAIPGQAGQFLVTESGSWEGRPGRVFRISVADGKATVDGRDDLPILANNTPAMVGDQYEGLACATAGPNEILVLLGERGGSSAFRRGRIRWATFDLASNTLAWTNAGRQGLEVSAPGHWLRGSRRDITAFHLDTFGTLWASASEEGGDAGPFRSVVYAAATVAPRAEIPVSIRPSPTVAWELAGTKVEGLAGPPSFWTFAVLLAASEDEFLGGRVFGLELVTPGR